MAMSWGRKNLHVPIPPSFESHKPNLGRKNIDDFLDDAHMSMVNITGGPSSILSAEEKMAEKGARPDYEIDANKFIENLTEFSLHLKKNPNEDERKPMAQSFLKNVNRWLYARKFKGKEQNYDCIRYLYEGILFPFSPTDGGTMSNLITRIIYKYPHKQ